MNQHFPPIGLAHPYAMANHERVRNDFYQSPRNCIVPLLREFPAFCLGGVLEPLAGKGRLVDQLKAEGVHVVATDLIDRGHPDVQGGIDFLRVTRLPEGCAHIISNPPYAAGISAKVIAHGIELAELSAHYLKIDYPGGCAPLRQQIMRQCIGIIPFSRKAGAMLPDGVEDAGMSPKGSHAWFVFARHNRDPFIRYAEPLTTFAGAPASR